MKLTLSLAIFLLLGCGQDYNSNSGDNALAKLGLDCSGAQGQQLCAAALVMVNNKCFQCHSAWTVFKTDQDWINAGLVVAASTSGSLLIQKLTNSGGNMPLGMGAISGQDYQTLLTWVQNL